MTSTPASATLYVTSAPASGTSTTTAPLQEQNPPVGSVRNIVINKLPLSRDENTL